MIEVADLSFAIDYFVNEKSFADDKSTTSSLISLFHTYPYNVRLFALFNYFFFMRSAVLSH